MRKLLVSAGAAAVLLAGIILARTALYDSDLPAVEPAPEVPVPGGAAERLAGSLRFPTISHEDPAGFDAKAFRALHAYLQAAFPRAHSELRRESESFRTLERTIRTVAPDAIVAPYLVVVVTDARHYGPLSRNVFRFLPVRLTPQDLERMHGTDERIEVRHYEGAVRMYRQLVLDAARS